MAYCLSCGKLRDTVGGLCDQCRRDEYLAKHNQPMPERKTPVDIKENDGCERVTHGTSHA